MANSQQDLSGKAGPDAIILVDHGSRLGPANALLEEVVAALRAMQSVPVFCAHMELAKPSIEDAFAEAVSSGARSVFVFPYFLSPGRHSQEDIPRLVAQAAALRPGVAWHVCGPFGFDQLMCQLVLARVAACSRCEERLLGTCPRCPANAHGCRSA